MKSLRLVLFFSPLLAKKQLRERQGEIRNGQYFQTSFYLQEAAYGFKIISVSNECVALYLNLLRIYQAMRLLGVSSMKARAKRHYYMTSIYFKRVFSGKTKQSFCVAFTLLISLHRALQRCSKNRSN